MRRGRGRDRFGRGLALAVVVLVSACAPGGAGTPPPETGQIVQYGPIQVFERRNVAYGSHAQQQLDLWRPTTTTLAPVVLYVHGGFWQDQPFATRNGIPTAVKDLLLHGYSVASMSYRGVNPEAGDVVHPQAIHDVKRAVAFLAGNRSTLGIGFGVRLVGFSAGGHLGAMAAMTYGEAALTPAGVSEVPIQSFVSVAGPTDLPALAAIVDGNGTTRAMGINDYVCGSPFATCWVNAGLSPMGHVSADDPPALLIYGTVDDLVPLAQGTTLANALSGAGVTAAFRTLPADHDHIEDHLVAGDLAAWLNSPSP